MQPVTFLVANVGPGVFSLFEPKSAQICQNCFQVQLTLLHEYSAFWGLARISQGTDVRPCGLGTSGGCRG